MSESLRQHQDPPSYHDVHVTTAELKRTALFDLPYGYELTCTRVGGWRLWGPDDRQLAGRVGPFPAPPLSQPGPTLIAGEYDEGLRVDVGGHVICDSLRATRADVDQARGGTEDK